MCEWSRAWRYDVSEAQKRVLFFDKLPKLTALFIFTIMWCISAGLLVKRLGASPSIASILAPLLFLLSIVLVRRHRAEMERVASADTSVPRAQEASSIGFFGLPFAWLVSPMRPLTVHTRAPEADVGPAPRGWLIASWLTPDRGEGANGANVEGREGVNDVIEIVVV
ncbi:hypothetical protein BDK51DRAFT_28370 [Blyttiomyces helicus]|uniref:Uncharacterized protein n=1 Tax=Blyttiomyces helicus TaxID=388810 RepID=A0A4P9WHS1_9FUNG|nr:hypothetical protein BDK51DRAFT_28370 [Blyttiomyces helicus]|eukprot:RKO92379.1 hypothetical protein BDK51DRAFT_28370 [Blyttiomyces helicus]